MHKRVFYPQIFIFQRKIKMAQITEIQKLNPDRVPVIIKARVISLWSASREQVAREGRLEDSTGVIPFTLWKSCPIKKIEKGQQYLFHRAGLGRLDGELRVQFEENSWAYPVDDETDVYRIMIKITQQEQSERKKTVKGVKVTRFDHNHTKRTKFSIAIAAGFVLWLIIMVLIFTDLLSEKKIRSFFQGRQALVKKVYQSQEVYRATHPYKHLKQPDGFASCHLKLLNTLPPQVRQTNNNTRIINIDKNQSEQASL